MKGGCGIGSRSEGAPPFTFHINSLHTKFIQFACSVRTNSEKRASDPRLSSPSSPSLSLLGKRGSLFNFQPFLLLSLLFHALSPFSRSLSLSLSLSLYSTSFAISAANQDPIQQTKEGGERVEESFPLESTLFCPPTTPPLVPFSLCG